MSLLSPPKERHLLHNATGGTILFLRTDLAGSRPAGGSVSHIKGVIKGFMDLGYKVVYVADAKLPHFHQKLNKLRSSQLDFSISLMSFSFWRLIFN